ncbi:MAG: 7-cyano-7-deazaguanine synthase [Pirellulales bacterium]
MQSALDTRADNDIRLNLSRAAELAAAQKLSNHVIVDINFTQFGGSALTSSNIVVPKHDNVDEIGSSIPVTYVPARKYWSSLCWLWPTLKQWVLAIFL